MKALEKDRTRRYETANGFAEDVQRFLSNEPIEARPPSTVYRLRKFVYKNRGLVTSITSIATLLLIGIWQSLAYAIELKLLTSVAVLLLIGIAATTWFAIAAKLAQRQSAKSEANAISERKNAEESRKKADVAALRARESELIAQSEATRARTAEQSALEEASRSEAAEKKTTEQLARSNFFLANYRWEQDRVDEANSLLYSIPIQHRNIEWHVTRRMFEGADVTMFGHKDYVNCVAFSPDGSRIVSGSEDKTLKLWDARTGAEVQTLKGHWSGVNSISFSPDGLRIVSGSGDNTLKLWDAHTGTELQTLRGDTSGVSCVAFSSDGSRIVSASYYEIKLWDARTGTETLTLQHPGGTMFSLNFSQDGKQIYGQDSSYEDPIRSERLVWNALTGDRQEPLADWASFNDPHRSADNRWLAIPTGNVIQIFNLESQNSPREIEYRFSKSRIDPQWHLCQAEAEGNSNWFSAAFHLAWELKAGSSNFLSDFRMRRCVERWKSEYVRDHMVESVDAQNQESIDILLPSVVRERLALTQERKIEASDGQEIIHYLRSQIESADKNSITIKELDLIKSVCEQSPSTEALELLADLKQILELRD